jgi:3-isopropylmalate/(R)-2-methylmalate dehydratase small subunit
MQAFTTHQGIVAPLDRRHVDTDLIIPKQFLKKIDRKGYGDYLFNSLRYMDEGALGEDVSKRPLNPDFVLNMARYRDASILLARDNFGCGSSREHALWALTDYGFRCVIAPSFADIFFSNCAKNGMLAVRLPAESVEQLFSEVGKCEGYSLSVDLYEQQIVCPDGVRMSFETNEVHRNALLKGLDEVGMSLDECAEQIRAFESTHRKHNSWVFDALDSHPS